MAGKKLVTLAAPMVFGAARVALGLLWLHEGIVKYRAHFGSADILLVADSASANHRVPEYFVTVADALLRHWPDLFGFATPLFETVTGVVLLVGVFSLPAAVGSLLALMTYWSADQLIAQYPVMGVLSAVVIAFPVAAARVSVTSLAKPALGRREWGERIIAGPAGRWL